MTTKAANSCADVIPSARGNRDGRASPETTRAQVVVPPQVYWEAILCDRSDTGNKHQRPYGAVSAWRFPARSGWAARRYDGRRDTAEARVPVRE